jgi:hypothetical protein
MKQNEIHIGLQVKVSDPSTCLPWRRATHIGRVAQIIRKPMWLAEVWTRHDRGGCWYTACEIHPTPNIERSHSRH